MKMNRATLGVMVFLSSIASADAPPAGPGCTGIVKVSGKCSWTAGVFFALSTIVRCTNPEQTSDVDKDTVVTPSCTIMTPAQNKNLAYCATFISATNKPTENDADVTCTNAYNDYEYGKNGQSKHSDDQTKAWIVTQSCKYQESNCLQSGYCGITHYCETPEQKQGKN